MAGLLTGCSATEPGPPAPTPTGPTGAPGSSTPDATAPGTATPDGTATGTTDSRIVVTRSGGIAGRSDTVTVEPDGRWRATERGDATRSGQLSPADLDRLRALARTATTGGTRGTPDARCADAFTYRLTVPTGSVEWTDCPSGPQPPPAAAAMAQLLFQTTG
ncbi:protealysin inhibitor emfourin [Micromonospora halophytica]|uniref:protealysin inhibitor emfourin n=1 Tax=Micromonospora halophytica TaxID=47864 RepID=UPI000B82F629|nr:protealysin inhibitor emfourin [Micromonospora halophytica]